MNSVLMSFSLQIGMARVLGIKIVFLSLSLISNRDENNLIFVPSTASSQGSCCEKVAWLDWLDRVSDVHRKSSQ